MRGPGGTRPGRQDIDVGDSLTELLEREQLTHPSSTVVTGRWPRPLGAAVHARKRIGGAPSPALVAIEGVLEFAYGYRTAAGRLRRGAASAGAMYPIEVMMLTGAGGAWRLLWYDFARHEALDLPGHPDAAASCLRLASGQSAVLVVAVLWRTMPRYGMRGYRYCLLDGGHVIDNIVSLASPLGARPRLPAVSSELVLARSLRLDSGEILIGAVAFDDAPLAGAAPLLRGPASGSVVAPSSDDGTHAPPHRPSTVDGSIMLACAVHGKTTGVVLDATQVAAMSDDLAIGAGAVADALRARSSARNFSGGQLGPDDVDALRGCVTRTLDACDEGGWTPPTARLAVVHRGRASVEAVAGARPVDSFADARQRDLPDLFGGQAIAAGASVLVVLGLARPQAADGLAAYRRALILFGMLCARLYRLGAARGLATTSMGGFHDDRLGDVVGGALSPLVVQAFGLPAAGDVKTDG